MITTRAHFLHFIDQIMLMQTASLNSTLSIASVLSADMKVEVDAMIAGFGLPLPGLLITDLSPLGMPLHAISYSAPKEVVSETPMTTGEIDQVIAVLAMLNKELANNTAGYVYGIGITAEAFRDPCFVTLLKDFHRDDVVRVDEMMGVLTFTKAK